MDKGTNIRRLQTSQKAFVILLISGLLLAACSPSSTQIVEITKIIPQTHEVTRIVTQEIVVTQIVTIVVEKVVTATTQPQLPDSEITTSFQKWTSGDVVTAYSDAGLEIEGVRPMTKDDYGLGPMVAVEGTRFLIPTLCADCGGRILNFSNQDELDLSKQYYVEMGKSSAIFFSWIFVKDNILVQINGDLSEEIARRYESVLNNLE